MAFIASHCEGRKMGCARSRRCACMGEVATCMQNGGRDAGENGVHARQATKEAQTGRMAAPRTARL